MITAYAMAAGKSAGTLEEDVNRLIKAGYQPYGTLEVVWSDGMPGMKVANWYQPMVKEGEQ
ncbi:hypothetical protein [Weissella tructae]